MTDVDEIGLRESRISAGAHELYRSLVDGFMVDGSIPGLDKTAQLRELASEDWLALDDAGRVSVLYPFSLTSTGIEVVLRGVTRYAMCAIDALGIAPMLGADVEIRTSCPVSGDPLLINVGPSGQVSADPDSVVVLRRRQTGAAHLSRCAATRFFSSSETAVDWRAAHGEAEDVILSLGEAFREAGMIFGCCYSSGVRMML